MPHCKFIFSGITVDPNKNIRPCCHIQSHEDSEIYYDDFDFSASTNFPELAIAMEGPDNWHPACIECRNSEEGDSERENSSRQIANRRYSELPPGQFNLIDLKTSNTCNLSCRMCHPGVSSSWKQIIKRNPDIVEDFIHLVGDDETHWDLDDRIINYIKNSELLKFTGGEPFLIKDVKKICKLLVEDRTIDTSKINLIINTNGQVILDSEWYDILNSYNTELHVSVDGVGSRYEYTRPGSNWNLLQDFMGNCQENFQGVIHVAGVYQALNYIQFDEIHKWAKSWNCECGVDEILYDPFFLNNSSVNPQLREKWGFPTIHDWDPANFEKMKSFMARLDQIHGTDFQTECPEFFDE